VGSPGGKRLKSHITVSTPPITDETRDAYERDGFVLLKGVLDDGWLQLLQRAIERVEQEAAERPRVMNLSAIRRDVTRRKGLADEVNDAPTDYLLAHNAWLWNEELRRVAFDSPLPALAAGLMGASQITFYFDQLFIKPPGSLLRTSFHQDLGYWTCRGDQICTFWAPIDPVTRENGAMGYVPGSHRWGAEFKANFFVDPRPLPGQEGADLPDIEADEAGFGVQYCECLPGDVIVHHVKTVHGSLGNRTSDSPRRSAALRYTGDGVVYHLPPGIPPDSTPVADDLEPGEPLGGALFPRIWTAADRTD
jgi:ectoine hydroxylase-related dioxygenase (phytanoyl-CoA dioxygenase family)